MAGRHSALKHKRRTHACFSRLLHMGLLLLGPILAGCTPSADKPGADAVYAGEQPRAPFGALPLNAGQSALPPLSLGAGARRSSGPSEIVRGTGQFVRPDTAGSRLPAAQAQPVPGPDATLDFVNVDVRDVVRSVLGDLLRLTYIIDPAVQGPITLQTGRPIPRSSVLPTLESSLQLNGIALVERDGVYRVLPIANAAKEARLGGPVGSGFVTRIVTPQYVAAVDLQRVLEPLLPPGSSVRADPSRNVLIVTGTEATVASILGNVSTFDVDFLRGMSFALLPLRNAQAKDLAREVTGLIGTSGASAGLVKVVPIDRLNAVLVTAMQPVYLDRVRQWVDRLDRGTNAGERRLYVYRVQNGRAADLASVLRKAIGVETSNASSAGSGASLPGGPGAAFGQGDAQPFAQGGLGGSQGGLGGGPLGGLGGSAASSGSTRQVNPLLGPLPTDQASAPSSSQGRGGQDGAGSQPDEKASGTRITADEVNNALVITATSHDYALIEAALQRLDIVPLQVLIEATIAEVTLTDQLSYGLQYYIKSGNFQAILGQGATNNVNSPFSGFNFLPGYDFAFSTAGGSSVILQLLSQLSTVRVLSSPNLMVLNNQPARLQVGDQVPIATQSAVSTFSSGAPVVNSIEYRDTGVILRVTPRVNASGLVLLDIAQEVSDVASTTTSSLNSPTISQRRLSSSVAVGDGQTIALGGLIRDNRATSKNGIPFLQDIPVLGALFGTRTSATTRTELIVLITPRVVRSGEEARAVTEELQRKLPLTIPVRSQRVR